MASARYRQLVRRLAKLRVHFLPVHFSPTGTYTADQLDKARAYRLLVHAEIESYLEDSARRIANESFKQWTATQIARPVIVHLLSFHSNLKAASQQDLKDEYASRVVRTVDAVQRAVGAFNAVLSNNHGVREDNILKILLPLGLRPAEIDANWLSTMDAFGVARGETAHKSIHTQQPIDPQTDLTTVTYLLKVLDQIDGTLRKIKI
jgi:hypothetical protein